MMEEEDWDRDMQEIMQRNPVEKWTGHISWSVSWYDRRPLVGMQLKELLDSSSLTDVTISTPGRQIKAHKLILSARSPVFAAMFKSDMKEAREGVVEISDFETEVVQGMLDYIYTGETRLVHERALDLLQIANKYDLPELQENCELALPSILKVEGIVKTLIVSYMMGSEMLMSKVIDFMGWHKEEIFMQEEFASLIKDHPDIFAELLKQVWRQVPRRHPQSWSW